MREIHHPEAAAPSSQRAGGLRLTTARLVLRDWTPADLPDLIEGLNDLRVSCWLAFVPHPYTSADAERWLTYCTQLREKEPHREQYEFAIELSSAQKVIGGVSLTRVSRLHGTAGGGIWINTRYQGQGYGSEAFGEKIRFAFEDLQLRRLENGFFTGAKEIGDSHSRSLSRFRATQHLTSGFIITLNDDTSAEFRTNLVAMHLWAEGHGDPNADPNDTYFLAGGVITGHVILGASGWRMTEITNQVIWRRGTGFQQMLQMR